MKKREIEFADVRPGDWAQHENIALDSRQVESVDIENGFVYLRFSDVAGPFPEENYTFYRLETGEGPRAFQKKPVEIEAVRWDYGLHCDGKAEVFAWMSDAGCKRLEGAAQDGESASVTGFFVTEDTGRLMIRTLEGTMRVSDGDWIIKGVEGEFYPCKPDVFEQTYEEL